MTINRDLFLPDARRAIIMALDQAPGWEEACQKWLFDWEQIALQNAIDLERGQDHRFKWKSA